MNFETWPIFKLGELSTVKGGKRLPKGRTLQSQMTNHPYLRLVDVNDGRIDEQKIMFLDEETHKTIARYIVKTNDVCLAIVGHTIGLVFYIDKKFDKANLTENAVKIECNEELDSNYLFYYLKSDFGQHQILSRTVGSAQGKLPIYNVKNIEIPLPKLVEQKYIAKVFKVLDQKIELNNAINKNLEEMAQALFKRWFIDFEFPNENGEPYKSSGGEFEESELGLIPKGWTVSSLDGIATYLNGLAMQKYRPTDEAYIPVIKIRELNQGRTSSDSDKASPEIDNKYIIQDGDVLFSWSGTLEVKPWCGGIGGLNQHLFKVTSEEFHKWFYYYWTLHYVDRFRSIAKDKATTMGHIKRQDLKDAKVVVPSEVIYQKANEIFHPIVDQVVSKQIESRNLEKLRDTLLPKLMSGEIRVPLEEDAEVTP
ncbi:restriction endonuclease subunit S [Saccharibacillus alkalitolerans]|uniref:Restriction endonuclease subunit S n=1 Tax=Saccharibacillus alkalitolerans TaxID=2705290 RepID=A0ABX0F0L2_9BACL|nr:restriction endonuclease subunit S [Saccharibacillus alkalitolerans]NGZ74075.1 restriction endonuclease subunit S [Saccharibacillus alkalitolerans]